MQHDRRRLLVAAASGLGTLLVPGISHAGSFHRRRCTGSQLVYAGGGDIVMNPFNTVPCPPGLNWSPYCTPPNAKIVQYTASNFTVYGTGLALWYSPPGDSFAFQINDNQYSVNWGNYSVVSVIPNAWNGYDALNFSASENTAPSNTTSTVTITISLTYRGTSFCPGPPWRNQIVKYA